MKYGLKYWQEQVDRQVTWIDRCLSDKTSSYYGDDAVEVKRADWNELVRLTERRNEAARITRGWESYAQAKYRQLLNDEKTEIK